MFRLSRFLVILALTSLALVGCTNSNRANRSSPSVETPNPAPAKKKHRHHRSHKKGGVFAQVTSPKREPRLSDETRRPVNIGSPNSMQIFNPEGHDVLSAVSGAAVECSDGRCQMPDAPSTLLPPPARRSRQMQPPLRSYSIPGAWRETMKGFLVVTSDKSDGTWCRATYLRAVRTPAGELIGINLFETPSHRSPFATVGSGAHEHFQLIEFAVNDAQSATVQWDGDQPVAVALYR